MKNKVYNHNGWKVISTDNGKYGLSYESFILDENTLGAMIEINEEVFNAACNPNVKLKDLFVRFDLYQNNVLYNLGERVTITKSKNTPTKYYGKGFIVTKENNKYYIMYQLAQHGGGNRKFEISKEIYQDARTGKYSTADIFKKYNLYHLDIPENNVKE